MLASDVYRQDGTRFHVGRRQSPQGVWDRQPADCRRFHYAAYNDRQHYGPLRCHWGARSRNAEGCSWNMSGRALVQITSSSFAHRFSGVTQMVSYANQTTRHSPVNQGDDADVSKPNKIGASTPFDFNARNLTYGGLLPVITDAGVA